MAFDRLMFIELLQNKDVTDFQIFKEIIRISNPTFIFLWSLSMLLFLLVGIFGTTTAGGHKIKLIFAGNYIIPIIAIHMLILVFIILNNYIFPIVSWKLTIFNSIMFINSNILLKNINKWRY